MTRRETNVDIFDDRFFEDIEKNIKRKKLREDRPWVYDMIRVLWSSGLMSMQRLTDELWEMRKPVGLPMPRKFKHTVQSFLN